RRHVEQLLGKRVDGIVVTARRVDRREPIEPAVRGLPVVYVFSRVEHPDAFCLLPDDEGGAKLAVRRLAALGRRRIASITGPERFEAVRLRDKGYRAALAEEGRPRCAFLRQRPDCARRDRSPARDGPCRADGRGGGRLRQLGRDDRGDPAAAHQRRHESRRAGTRGRRGPPRNDGGREACGRATAAVLPRRPGLVRRKSPGRDGEASMTKAPYSPAPFADVRVAGPFWRERLEAVLTRTIPSQHAKLEEVGILESLKLP